MKERIRIDDPDYNQSQRPTPNQGTGKTRITTIIIVVAIIGVAIFFALQNGTKGKLNGEYITQTAISDNLINFSSNGGFARFARTFGDWELVAGGKYTLKGKTLTLRCSDGRTWEFQYDRATDTLWQIEPNLYFTRYD